MLLLLGTGSIGAVRLNKNTDSGLKNQNNELKNTQTAHRGLVKV